MAWERKHYWIEACDLEAEAIAAEVFSRVLRESFDQPGFAIIAFPRQLGSKELRKTMVGLKESLSELFHDHWGESLAYLSLGRFDQQTTTKLHLDGAPERSVLMLGYEPTEVSSEFHIADYAACASALQLTPEEFLAQHNPMFADAMRLLAPYVTEVADWHEDRPRIVVVNNSSVSRTHPKHTAGVMHGARIPTPDRARRRVINSTMMAPVQSGCDEDEESVLSFINTDRIAGPIPMRQAGR
jgi:hypothetical protein